MYEEKEIKQKKRKTKQHEKKNKNNNKFITPIILAKINYKLLFLKIFIFLLFIILITFTFARLKRIHERKDYFNEENNKYCNSLTSYIILTK